MAFLRKTLLACASIVCIVQAGHGPTGGFRWGEWSEWEACKKPGKQQKRRRVCMGPITMRKVAKERCIGDSSLEGTTISTRICTEDEFNKQSGIAKNARMESSHPSEQTRWQPWTSWSRCASNQRKRYRFCASAFRREIKPNRVCKNFGLRMGGSKANGSAKANKDVQPCSTTESKAEARGSDRVDHTFQSFSRLNVKLSQPECYYPPGTKVLPDEPMQPLRLGTPNSYGSNMGNMTGATGRIVGGKVADEDEHPHIVMLSYKGFGGYGQFCDGSIIHSRYILTAAHCFVGWDESPGTYEVVVGAYNKVEKRENQATYFLESITCHENYRVSSRQIIYDICLLKTTEDIKFNKNVWPICLPDDLPPPNDGTYDRKCVVAGWGDTRFTGDERMLNEVQVPVVTYDTCVDWYEAENILIDVEQHVCAGYEEGGKDACQGDSGGPFVCKRDLTKIGGQHTELKVLTGIVSFGVGCAQEKNPGVYSNVNYFLPYIFKVVNDHDACFPENPCENDGFCIDTFHGYKCQCKGNYVGKNCEQDKNDIDACYNNQCQNGQCVVNEGDSSTYRCECDEDFAGLFCETLTNPCRGVECNNGECTINDNGAPVCTCAVGWAGASCDSDIDECALDNLNNCIDSAQCRNTDGAYECVCDSGFDGDGKIGGTGCQDIDECADRLHNCGPQSICQNTEGAFTCRCREGYQGNPPAVRCQRMPKTQTIETDVTCNNIITEFANGIYLKYPNGSPRYDVECGVGTGSVMSFADLVANQSQKHPKTSNPGGKGGDSACVLQCRPGQIGQFPAFSRLDGGQKARIECLQKKLGAAWKPNKNQIRCFGCNPIPGVELSDCDVKGKKAVNCQARCSNGNGGPWTLKCNKFRGKFNWAKQMFEMITNTCA